MSETRSNALQPGNMQGPSPNAGIDNVDQIRKAFRRDPIEAQHRYNKAVYQKTVQARNMLGHIRRELDGLSDKGDTVTPEEVITAASRLVGHGVPARDLAALLADMPVQAGQGLAAWITNHEAAVRLQEIEVDRVRAIAQHRMGVSALKSIAMTHINDLAIQRSAEANGMAQAGGALGPQPPAAEMGQQANGLQPTVTEEEPAMTTEGPAQSTV